MMPRLRLKEIEAANPDIVITDVIMPDKDGYDVCQHIKSHPGLAKTPVILMSGVVNRAVAEKAFAVKADELLRKPFQPQDLIARVKHLLNPNGAPAPTPAAAANAAVALSSIFSAAAAPMPPRSVARCTCSCTTTRCCSRRCTGACYNHAIAGHRDSSCSRCKPVAVAAARSDHCCCANCAPRLPLQRLQLRQTENSANLNDAGKLKIEIMRLEGLVKKLQSELQAEREYSRALGSPRKNTCRKPISFSEANALRRPRKP